MKGMIFNLYGVVIRKHPDNVSKPVGELECFDLVDILNTNGEYTLIKKGAITGYIESEFVDVIKER